MLRTNSKKARENIRRYIIEDKDYILERAEYDKRELNTDDEILSYAWEIFESEMSHEIKKHYGCANFGIFLDWARGLALGGLFCYYYNRWAKDDLAKLLEESESEKNQYTEEQARELLTRLIYRELWDANKREFLKSLKGE